MNPSRFYQDLFKRREKEGKYKKEEANTKYMIATINITKQQHKRENIK